VELRPKNWRGQFEAGVSAFSKKVRSAMGGIGSGPKNSSEVWPSIKERLMSQVRVVDGGCWLWTGSVDSSGYGQFKWDCKHYRAHRVSYEVHKGPIGEGKLVLHTCDVPACCNPAHLVEGTDMDNSTDKVAKGRQAFLRGQDNGSAKLTEVKVRQIRQLLRNGQHTQREIGDMFGVSNQIVNNINLGKNWKHMLSWRRWHGNPEP
jgi:hypothetical protein